MTNIEMFDRTALSALEVGLAVDAMAPMKRFYCEGLGFQPAGHVVLTAAHIEAFRFGDCLLKLSLFREEQHRPKPRSDPGFYITLRVARLDQVVSSVLATGASLLVPISTAQTAAFKTVRYAFVADPMGNRIQLVEGDAWSSEMEVSHANP